VQPQPPVLPAPPAAEETVTYTTRPGDSLWKIASNQCGSGSMTVINKIRELNKDVVKGDIIKPNVTLKLPKKGS
jgi:LysM repeat protein